MAAFAEDAQDFMAAEGAYLGEMAAMGYPWPFVGVGFPAFDIVSDYFRSLRGSTLDMFRQPDKLLAMIDVMLPAVDQPHHRRLQGDATPRAPSSPCTAAPAGS